MSNLIYKTLVHRVRDMVRVEFPEFTLNVVIFDKSNIQSVTIHGTIGVEKHRKTFNIWMLENY